MNYNDISAILSLVQSVRGCAWQFDPTRADNSTADRQAETAVTFHGLKEIENTLQSMLVGLVCSPLPSGD